MTPSSWLHLLLFLLIVGPLAFVLFLSAIPGHGLAGPPRRLFYRVHRSRRLFLAVGPLAWGVLVLRWAEGLADPLWPILGGLALAAVLAGYFLAHPIHLFQTIRQPRFRAADPVEIPEDMLVLGLDRDGPPRAYTLDTLIQPHGAVDTLGEETVLVIWCSLSNTASALHPGTEVSSLENFRPATAINDNLCYYDLGNGNLFQQIEDGVVCGPDAGRRSDTRPVTVTTWRMWQRLHPDTLVCHMAPARLHDRFVRHVALGVHRRLPTLDRPFHPIDRPLDPRLPPMTPVLAVSHDSVAKAWPRALLHRCRILCAEVGGEPLVLLADAGGEMAAAYSRRLGDRVLRFELLEALDATELPPDQREILAARSPDGSLWDLAGRCVAGPRQGDRLESPPHFQCAFWFSWARYHPETEMASLDPTDRERSPDTP